MNRKQRFQELAKAKGKIYLSESTAFSSDSVQIEIFETKRLVESAQTTFDAHGIVRNIPVTRYGINRNDRLYPKSLWIRIANNGSFNGTFCLADHSDDENPASVRNICGTWHNFRVEDDGAYADLYCYGEYGELLLKALKAGSKYVGFSTNGFGELLEDGYTVNPESFEIAVEESGCDWVFMPSQQVFAKPESVEVPQAVDNKPKNLESILETTQIERNSIKEDTNKTEQLKSGDFTEKIMDEKNLESIQQKLNEQTELSNRNLRSHTELAIKEAYKASDKAEATARLTQALNTIKGLKGFEAQEIKLQEAIEKVAESAKVELTSKETEISSLKEKSAKVLSVAKTAYESLREKHKQALALIDKQAGALKKGNGVVPKLTESVKDVIFDLAVVHMKEKNKRKLNELLTLIPVKERNKFISDLKKVKENLDGVDEVDATNETSDPLGPMNPPRDSDLAFFDEESADDDVQGEEEVAEDDLSSEDEEEMEEGTDPQEDVMPYQYSAEEEHGLVEEEEGEGEDEFDFVDDEDGAEDEEFAEGEDDLGPDFEDEEVVEPVLEKKRETAKKPASKKPSVKEQAKKPAQKQGFKCAPGVKQYYEAVVAVTPAIKDIRKKVLTSKSFKEAVKVVTSFTKKETDRAIPFKESSTQKPKVPKHW